MKDENKLARFVEQNPDADLHGFYWRSSGEYHVVILARAGSKGRTCEAAEFSASDADRLIATVERAGYILGDGKTVAALCESAPASRPRRRQRGAA